MFSVHLRKAFVIDYDETPEPVLQPGGAIVRIDASGICGSDMHRYCGEESVKNPNVVCGHELGGVIEAIADDVKGLYINQKVAVNPTISCGTCWYCRHGLSYLCDHQGWIHAMTEKAFVPAQCLVPVPDDFDTLYTPLFEPAATAIHTCSGIENKNVVLIGLGTVGLFAMQILKKQGNRVVLADVSEFSMEQARKIGGMDGKVIVDLRQADCEEQIASAFNGDPVDYVVDGVGITPTVDRALRVIKKRGVVRIVGASRESMTFDCRTALLKEAVIESIYIYTEDDYRTAAKIIVSGEIEYKPIVTQVFSLHNAKEAFDYKQTQPSTKVLLRHI